MKWKWVREMRLQNYHVFPQFVLDLLGKDPLDLLGPDLHVPQLLQEVDHHRESHYFRLFVLMYINY